MTTPSPQREVRIEEQIRVTFPSRPDLLAKILETLRIEAGNLLAHLVYELADQSVGLFVCEKPSGARLALEAAGLKPELETVVMANTENRWGALSHLLKMLAEEGIHVGYSYAASLADDLCVVLRTDDNAKAAEALRRYLVLSDEEAT